MTALWALSRLELVLLSVITPLLIWFIVMGSWALLFDEQEGTGKRASGAHKRLTMQCLLLAFCSLAIAEVILEFTFNTGVYQNNQSACDALYRFSSLIFIFSKLLVYVFLYVKVRIVHDEITVPAYMKYMRMLLWPLSLIVLPTFGVTTPLYFHGTFVEEVGLCLLSPVTDGSITPAGFAAECAAFVLADLVMSCIGMYLFGSPLTAHIQTMQTYVSADSKAKMERLVWNNVIYGGITIASTFCAVTTLGALLAASLNTDDADQANLMRMVASVMVTVDFMIVLCCLHSLTNAWQPKRFVQWRKHHRQPTASRSRDGGFGESTGSPPRSADKDQRSFRTDNAVVPNVDA